MSYIDTENDETGFEPVPEGTYQVMVDRIEVKQTKAKQNGTATKGELFEVALDILNDAFAGRKLFERFNVQNDNPDAAKIGRGQFSSMCKAIGIKLKLDEPTDKAGAVITDFDIRKTYFDTELQKQLKDKVCVARVAVVFDDFRKANVNVIKGFLPKETPLTAGTGTTEKPPF